ncbi:sensor histidine kinase [Sphingomonas turrisvirgatae]|uniref:sensor histidine kinase n=1 Tax=Sphingomonas turrisvirgatae TaxID=1888892 RepID=UPI000ABE3205|nr:histidine kinase dimerization/phosphoacceptor domain -containing protein [Sphingomonas turrisvirgatae]
MSASLKRVLERLPLAADRPWIGYAVAFLVSVLALLVRFALDASLPPGFPYVTFFPAVVTASFLFGRGPGILTAVLCGVAALYFFIPPFRTFNLGRGTGLAVGLYVAVVTVDILLIDWMQRANARLQRERERGEELAARAELLFHELQHRVSNNLQMIGSVLSLQRRKVTDPAASQALGDAVAKLQTIGRIQRQLYNSDGAHLALDRFLPDLAQDLVTASGQPGIGCTVDCQAGVQLEPHAAIPVALIVAEAVANAIEHGFGDRDGGSITIRVARDNGWLDLAIIDDGIGPPAGFDAARSDSLGLRIARTLAEQLGGEFTLARHAAGGAVTRLHFPLDRRAPA